MLFVKIEYLLCKALPFLKKNFTKFKSRGGKEEAIGLRLKRLHIINGSKLFDVVLSIIKQALTEKLVHRIIVHDNIESIHKYISPEILPKDYGGKDKSIKELCESTLKEMCTNEHIEQLKASEGAMTDESYRVTLKFDEEYLGMPGSFKTLNVD